MTEKDFVLQIELLQKQNKELKAANGELRKQLKDATEQIEDIKLQADINQAINFANKRRN